MRIHADPDPQPCFMDVILLQLVLTCGAAMRFISRSLVCSGPSLGLLFLSASRRKAVHCWTMFCSKKQSTICVMSASGSSSCTTTEGLKGCQVSIRYMHYAVWADPY